MIRLYYAVAVGVKRIKEDPETRFTRSYSKYQFFGG